MENIRIVLEAPPASALVGMGLLLLLFGLPLVSVWIVLYGIFLGALPGYLLYTTGQTFGSLVPYETAILLGIVGAFSGGYLALAARKAIKFILVGLAWLILIGTIWPAAYSDPFGGMVALIGFFVAGYFADHLFIIATSVEGAMLVLLGFLQVLGDNYSGASATLRGYPATLFAVGAIIAFLGCIIQTHTVSKLKPSTGEECVIDEDMDETFMPAT